MRFTSRSRHENGVPARRAFAVISGHVGSGSNARRRLLAVLRLAFPWAVSAGSGGSARRRGGARGAAGRDGDRTGSGLSEGAVRLPWKRDCSRRAARHRRWRRRDRTGASCFACGSGTTANDVNTRRSGRAPSRSEMLRRRSAPSRGPRTRPRRRCEFPPRQGRDARQSTAPPSERVRSGALARSPPAPTASRSEAATTSAPVPRPQRSGCHCHRRQQLGHGHERNRPRIRRERRWPDEQRRRDRAGRRRAGGGRLRHGGWTGRDRLRHSRDSGRPGRPGAEPERLGLRPVQHGLRRGLHRP
jgi:hypothetical protein